MVDEETTDEGPEAEAPEAEAPEAEAEVHVGIKETKEAIIGACELSALLLKHLKDGFQLGKDLTGIWSDFQTNGEIKASLEAAYDGIKKVPAEVKDINLEEAMELAVTIAGQVPKFTNALKKED